MNIKPGASEGEREREMWAAVSPLPYFAPNLVLNNPTNSNSISTTFSIRLKPDGYRFNKKFVKANFKPAFRARCSSATHGGSSSSAGGEDPPQQDQEPQNEGFWKKWWRENSAEISSVLAELGFWSVLVYVLIDWDNPASFANILSCLGMMAYNMLIGDDALRPLRVADAAALALVFDRGLRRIQKHFNFPSPDYAFALVVSVVTTFCLIQCLLHAGLLMLLRKVVKLCLSCS